MIGSMKEMRDDAAMDFAPSTGIPAIDAAQPATFETATFALG